MKKYFSILIILIAISCEKSDQFTSVEGYVTDYYSKEPLPNIPMQITGTEYFCYVDCYKESTVMSDTDGHYYFDFISESIRYYTIKALQTETYFSGNQKSINKGETNTINFSIKPYKILTLNCYNQSNTFNALYISYTLVDFSYTCKQCEMFSNHEIKIIPEEENIISIQLAHYYETDKIDTSKSEDIEFFAGINDTTINYYY
ncbi:MAG: hypothetical protein K9H26_19185 [Prolixibacteraceae bacterium]|nr:hypothetical protein [Prolixibacteraceae bacterium]